MDAGLLVQYAIIAVAVIASAWFVAKRQFPNAVRRLRVAVAVPMVRDGRASWLQKLGRRIAPAAMSNDGACGGCNSCGPSEPKRH
ncbi:DUF6587 family protein [Lysobacter changpingensis]|uniref:DUF6587 family protein n=1 Tax=Lysobacter changpingensis TaxID=2792784 RepID=UPI001A8E1ED3|nr:DUF6587 family protein [Lysobacter changpingensis]